MPASGFLSAQLRLTRSAGPKTTHLNVRTNYTDPGVADLDELNSMIHRQLVYENEFLPSTTQVAGHLAIRPCFIGARTLEIHAPGLVETVLRIGNTMVAQLSEAPTDSVDE